MPSCLDRVEVKFCERALREKEETSLEIRVWKKKEIFQSQKNKKRRELRTKHMPNTLKLKGREVVIALFIRNSDLNRSQTKLSA